MGEVVTKSAVCESCGNVVDVEFELPSNEAEQVDVLAQFIEATKDNPDAPREEELKEMKAKYNDIYVFPFGTSLYLYRAVLGEEYEKIVDSVSKLVQSAGADPERELSSQVCYKCVLWPKIAPSIKGKIPAGVIPTLANLIHMVSGFFASPDLQNMIVSM